MLPFTLFTSTYCYVLQLPYGFILYTTVVEGVFSCYSTPDVIPGLPRPAATWLPPQLPGGCYSHPLVPPIIMNITTHVLLPLYYLP